MHQQVASQLSYEAVFSRLLHFAADYYRSRAAAEAHEDHHA